MVRQEWGVWNLQGIEIRSQMVGGSLQPQLPCSRISTPREYYVQSQLSRWQIPERPELSGWLQNARGTRFRVDRVRGLVPLSLSPQDSILQ